MRKIINFCFQKKLPFAFAFYSANIIIFYFVSISIYSSLAGFIYSPGDDKIALKFLYTVIYILNFIYPSILSFIIVYQKNWPEKYYFITLFPFFLAFGYGVFFVLLFPTFLFTVAASPVDKYKRRLEKNENTKTRAFACTFLGVILLFISILISLGIVLGQYNFSSSNISGIGFVPGLTVVMMGLSGSLLIKHGKSLYNLYYAYPVSLDSKPIVLYLRTFDSDRKEMVDPMAMMHPLLMAIRSIGVTIEEDLSAVFSEIGQFIAIGDPQELIPEPGAKRLYISHQEWQSKVISLIKKSKIVIIRAGISENLFWEISRCIQYSEPERILIYLPYRNLSHYNRENLKKTIADRYVIFRERVNKILPLPLPKEVGRSRFIIFEKDWSSACARAIPAWKMTIGLRGSQMHDMKHELDPFLRRFEINEK